jgi:hypothetical protein
VHGGLLGRDASTVDQSLHEGVIGGDLLELAGAEPVDARVADVRHRQFVAEAQHRADGCAHAGQFRMLENGLGDQRVRGEERRPKGELGVVRGRERLVNVDHSLDRNSGCDVASGVATHSVGHHEQVGSRIAGVLVVGADLADVRYRRTPACGGHSATAEARRWSFQF